MSKTYSIQIEKARTLLDGLRKNYSSVSPYGVTNEALDQLEREAAEADRMNDELDALRAQVSEKSSVANQKLNDLRIHLQELKGVVKKNFDQTRWEALGVPDKR
ncbi:MAG: hypothetical protein IKK67_04705 [Bacteroidaceae bacterium]|nr:hypothetical protein [Bacteroidaceae bacterium]